jgi:hypothetical protein
MRSEPLSCSTLLASHWQAPRKHPWLLQRKNPWLLQRKHCSSASTHRSIQPWSLWSRNNGCHCKPYSSRRYSRRCFNRFSRTKAARGQAKSNVYSPI